MNDNYTLRKWVYSKWPLQVSLHCAVCSILLHMTAHVVRSEVPLPLGHFAPNPVKMPCVHCHLFLCVASHSLVHQQKLWHIKNFTVQIK